MSLASITDGSLTAAASCLLFPAYCRCRLQRPIERREQRRLVRRRGNIDTAPGQRTERRRHCRTQDDRRNRRGLVADSGCARERNKGFGGAGREKDRATDRAGGHRRKRLGAEAGGGDRVV